MDFQKEKIFITLDVAVIFLGMTPKAKATKEKKIDTLEYIKTKNFCVKPTINSEKATYRMGANISNFYT